MTRPPETPERLRNWGLHAVSSPLYHRLIEVIATDTELLRVINRIENFPRPNVLFGAVHHLLLEGADHELRRFFASVADPPDSPEDAGPAFRSFVLEHEDQLVVIGRTRLTQTNECRRCVSLLPGLMSTRLHRFHLVEIGASAGLNLAMDRYHYSWSGIEWGPESNVRLATELRGRMPDLHEIEVLSRVGLDLNPLHPDDPQDRSWLEALIWPEHEERRARLRAAFEVAATLDIELIPGDAVETLDETLTTLPDGEGVIVMDSFSLNQVTDEGLESLARVIAAHGRRLALRRVSLEPVAADAAARLRVRTPDGWLDLARSQHHGEWVEFYARP